MARDNWQRNSFDAARPQQTEAQDLLDDVKATKRQAATRPPDGAGRDYQRKAEQAATGTWPTGGFDELSGATRTTT